MKRVVADTNVLVSAQQFGRAITRFVHPTESIDAIAADGLQEQG